VDRVPDATAYMQEFGPWLLVFNRVLGVFLFTPLLASSVVPLRFRVLLAAAFAVAVYPFVPGEFRVMPDATLAQHATMMFGELLIGACIGFIAGLPMIAMEMAGHLMGHQMALSLAQSYNPELEANLNSVGSLLFFMGISAFVMMGGPETVLMILADTFRTLPMGGFGGGATPLDLVLGVLTTGTDIAIRVSAPAIGIIMACMVAMGFVMKSMPQVMVLSVGFAVYIVGGLSVLTLALFAINDTLGGYMTATLGDLWDWVLSAAPNGGAAG
jgi:flagellar biosynthetic protein FliR